MDTPTVVSVKDVQKTYGKANEKQYTALKGVTFDVQRGEFVGIMGASGSGKTTLLNILSTLDKPTAGEVKINDQEISRLKGNALADFRAQEIGFMFQDFNLLENLTAYENMALPLTLQNVTGKKVREKITTIAKTLSIDAILNK